MSLAKITLALVASAMASAVDSIALAESGSVMTVEYGPIIERANGRFVTCGIHYSAVVQGTDRLVGVQGSWNSMYFPDHYPGMSMKAVAVAPDGEALQKVPMSSAHYKGNKFNTFAMSQDEGDHNSRLIFYPLTESLEMYEHFQSELPSGFWVFLTFEGATRDFSFKLPAFDASNGGDEALLENARCNAEAMTTWMADNMPE